ncbi:MAG: hypothetical protein WC379_15650 [Methanoregula sp.]|jgi:hypothetical protein
MADTPPSPDRHDAVPEPGRVCPERDLGGLVRDVRERIETDRLHEQSLQRHLIERSRSAGTCQRRIPD